MRKVVCPLLLILFAGSVSGAIPDGQDPGVAQAIAQGDELFAKQDYDKALDAYRKADKLAHHTSAVCYLRMFSVERKAGDLPAALEDAKKAAAAAGADKGVAAKAHLARGFLLAEMTSKPTDKKLKESEAETREALATDPGMLIAHFNLGIVLLKQERDADGIAELNSFIASPGADAKTISEARRAIADPARVREPLAPDFSFTPLDGIPLSNDALRGRVVVLDFWGTWCPVCREALPSLIELQKKYRDKQVTFVSVSSDNDEQTWKSFIAKNHMDWPQYIDLSGEVLRDFNINSYPTYIVLDRDGVIRFHESGYEPQTDMEMSETINKALKKSASPQVVSSASAPATVSSPSALAAPPVVAASSPATPSAVAARTPAAAANTGAADAVDPEIAAGSVSGNTYQNSRIGVSYQFPKDWAAAKEATLATASQQVKAAVAQRQQAAGAQAQILIPEAIFYAVPRGSDDGLRVTIPSVRIIVVQWPGPFDIERFRGNAQRRSASGMMLVGSVEESSIGGHAVFHATYLGTQANITAWFAQIQTLTGGYLVTLEFYAASKDELDQLAATAQTLAFSKP
jgi:thiol-disulfide isomerase/thioredoxin